MSSQNNNTNFKLSEVFNVQGKVALVTGGGSGIGLMATQALAVNGAKVYIVGRTKEKLDTVVERYGRNIAGEIIPLVGDVTRKDGTLVREIDAREKCLCILVNNAGIASGKTAPEGKDAEELKSNLFDPTTLEEWTSVYTTNVVSPYLMTTAFLPLLQRATEQHYGYSGTVINITSISGLLRISQGGQFPYNASKGAFIHLNKMLAVEVANAGLKVRVNGIAPGRGSSGDQKSSIPKEQREGLPSGRPGHDRDMAAAILFAASCQYLNGQNIPVDGGYLLQVGQ
ncbi:hypothetical protein B0H14DRAFT_3089072 [Mycena olivaceomarginata]|nr:hypothetical protein B0H14DRAFT_3089072 [Mycena olivaceomarginata]